MFRRDNSNGASPKTQRQETPHRIGIPGTIKRRRSGTRIDCDWGIRCRGRSIRFVPFELVVRNLYFRSDFDMRTVSRAVGPIGIKLCRSMMHWGHPAAPVLPAGRSKQASCRGAPSGADHASAGALSRRGTYENGASAVPVRGIVRCSVYVLTLFRFRQSVAVAASG